MLSGKLPYAVKAYHDQYGSVVRVAPDELSFNDSAAWRDIYLKQTLDRPPQWGAKPPGIEAENFISAPAAVHSRLRRAFNPAFSEKAVRGYEPTVTQFVDRLITRLRSFAAENESGETTVDVIKWLNFAFFDIIMELGWGSNFNCLERAQYNLWLAFVMSLKEKLIATAIAYYPSINVLMPYLMPPAAKKQIDEVFGVCSERVRDRLLRKGTSRQDMFESVLNDPEHKNVTIAEMDQASMVIIAAGSETLTSTLVGTLNYLLRSPSKYDRLVQEVRSSFASEADITGQTTRSLPYLNAVLKEGLRIAPPIPDGLRRQVPADGLVVAGVPVPEKMSVSTGCWIQFMNPENFSNPTEFVPERWLGEGTETAKTEAFHPFGLGARGCLGQTLAWLEMRLTLAKLLWNFDISVPPGKSLPAWVEQDIFWFWDKKPLELSLRPRQKT
ncbi:hypothetical protein T310_4645 [Rasamsonia emersonii CBS 393.64]|uniref:Cytochrome P450 n=1 Tax=Rasamsonia emersonii (strain ATCC 16479 / CBS 393.64 / IMI 116815) TaxID=1408163 RepID=A0A0F4YU18_RASE3|nr:hypothetical protein T310_4645 [Rasamsonia emersonii CBS 393.64]KKA21341.1 hypothetical protein T310_4645 [Rasamsonia emersonii CBS 393.64]